MSLDLLPKGSFFSDYVQRTSERAFGCGLRVKSSSIEFEKTLVDAVHSWYSEQPTFLPVARVAELHSIRLYDSIVAIEKQIKDGAPRSLKSKNGGITTWRKWVEQENRQSVFRGKDDS